MLVTLKFKERFVGYAFSDIIPWADPHICKLVIAIDESIAECELCLREKM